MKFAVATIVLLFIFSLPVNAQVAGGSYYRNGDR